MGRVLNPYLASYLEREPCRFYDLTILPRDGLLQNYYSTPEEFFDQLEELVLHAKAHTGVRVFNLSIGAPGARDRLGYSPFASYLDRVARDNDVIFVVSSGNLRGPDQRPEWPADNRGSVGDASAKRGPEREYRRACRTHLWTNRWGSESSGADNGDWRTPHRLYAGAQGQGGRENRNSRITAGRHKSLAMRLAWSRSARTARS